MASGKYQFIPPERRIKCLAVGDDGVGKTSLLMTHCVQKGFPTEWVPSFFGGGCLRENEVNGIWYELGYFDTIGGTSADDPYKRIRSVSYHCTDIMIVCFSVVKPSSFERIKEQWIDEIKEHCPKVPFFIIGLQTDLRENEEVIDNLAKENLQPISKERGERLAWRFGAEKYLECSAKTGENIDDVFREAILTALAHPQVEEQKSLLKSIKDAIKDHMQLFRKH